MHESAGGGGGGAGLSDIAAEGVTETPSAGTGTDASRWDHEHDIPFNSTLEWDSNSQFGVRVQDVIEHLQERIRYFTFATGTSDAGATVGAAYTTSGYRKLITKVDVNFAASSGSDSFVVRLDELNSDNSIKAKLFTSATRPTSELGTVRNTHHFLFHNAAGDVGVPIDAGIRLGVLLSRLGDDSDSAVHAVHGTESSSSPDTTYADAEVDFDYVTSLVYQHINPAINADTHSHGTDIRGNIKIYYTLILDHGNFVVGTDDQNAGEVPVTATGFTGNLSATDTDVQTALDTIDALSLGGGGASDTDTDLFLAPIEAAAVGGLSTSGVNRLILTEANAIVNRGGFTVEAAAANQAIAVPVDGTYAIGFTLYMQDSTAATRSEIRAEIVILRGSAEEAALRTPFTRYYRDNVANDEFYISGAITMDLLAADEIQLLISEMANSSATFSSGANNSKISVARLAGGGGGLTTSEQTSLSNAKVLTSREFNGSGNGIATLGAGTAWPTNSPNTFVVTATEYDTIDRIEFVFRQNGKVDLPFIITRGVLDEIAAGAFMPNDPGDNERIRGVFYAGRIGPAHRNTNYFVINPRFDFMEERREASDNCILLQYGLNGTLFTGVFIRARQPSGALIFQSGRVFYWEDA